jgi:hypothetical protein
MTVPTEGTSCVHACAWGCGRPYDVIVVQVVDNSTLMLCLPDFVSFSANVAKAMTEPNDPEVIEVTQGANLDGVMVVTDTDPSFGVVGHSDPMPEDEFQFDGTD